jgi:short-subunit dehydrogenase
MKEKMMSELNQKVALVTGASAGIGQATVEALRAAGYRVFGTSRKAATSKVNGVTMLVCDVTDDASVKKLVDEVLEGAGRIDLLVNNAGFGITGAAEESSIAQVRSMFETNVFGLVRVTNAVLPIMRTQRGGRILNVGSVAGLGPFPFGAHYAATKHAVEGYSESLDHEVRDFGIRVAVIEPAATKTSFEASTVIADVPHAEYNAARIKYTVAFDRTMSEAASAESVAETIVLAAQDRTSRLRYSSGKAAGQIAFARRFFPRTLFDKILRKQFGLA